MTALANNTSISAALAVNGLTALVDDTVEARLRNQSLFTSLDISNEIKRKRWQVRHKQVAEMVRELHAMGAMQAMGYDRVLIEVNTENGEKTTEAFLYLPVGKHPSDYAGRVQDALPPLDGSAALDPAGYVPLTPSTLRARATGKVTGRRRTTSGGKRGKFRRDGALPVPRALVQQAGFHIGDLLTVVENGQTLQLIPAPTSGAAITGKLVKVWADFRVRVAKTKLHAAVDMTNVQVRLQNGAVEVAW